MYADYTGICAQFRCAPTLPNTQEWVKWLRNKSLTKGRVHKNGDTKNIAIAIPKLSYIS